MPVRIVFLFRLPPPVAFGIIRCKVAGEIIVDADFINIRYDHRYADGGNCSSNGCKIRNARPVTAEVLSGKIETAFHAGCGLSRVGDIRQVLR